MDTAFVSNFFFSFGQNKFAVILCPGGVADKIKKKYNPIQSARPSPPYNPPRNVIVTGTTLYPRSYTISRVRTGYFKDGSTGSFTATSRSQPSFSHVIWLIAIAFALGTRCGRSSYSENHQREILYASTI